MKERFLQNLDLLKKNHVNVDEHDACGVGFVVSMNGKPKREVILNGINALKAVWHRGAVDADGKTGDGAGLHFEFSKEFFKDKIESTGHHKRLFPVHGRFHQAVQPSTHQRKKYP